MIKKIIIIALASLLLTACGKNNTTSENEIPLENNNYARLSDEAPFTMERNTSPDDKVLNDTPDNTINNEPFGEEKKDYIADSFENDEVLPKEDDSALATFTTPILTSDPNRYHNITLVRDKLNGYVLQNNEIFSFNEVCGPYGKDDGFKEATILLSNGKEDKGYGGGVCQLSTTLYNAVKDLDVAITERHHHSTPVAYIKNNEDATVSLQSNLDFKFKNTSGKPLEFKAESTKNSLTVYVYEANY